MSKEKFIYCDECGCNLGRTHALFRCPDCFCDLTFPGCDYSEYDDEDWENY